MRNLNFDEVTFDPNGTNKYPKVNRKGAVDFEPFSNCPRRDFMNKNDVDDCTPCYGGCCYAARSVYNLLHQKDGLGGIKVNNVFNRKSAIKAIRLAKDTTGLIRDSVSTDGSLSIASGKTLELLEIIKELKSSVKVVSVCSCYMKIKPTMLKKLRKHKKNHIIHVSVSGWHTMAENRHRYSYYKRFREYGLNAYLRVVYKDGWANQAKVDKMVARNGRRVIETPYHQQGKRNLDIKKYREGHQGIWYHKPSGNHKMVCCNKPKKGCSSCRVSCGA